MKFEDFKKRFFEATPRYRWLGTLGRGGAGVVFKAFDEVLEAVVAIKVLAPSFDRDENALLARFKREIQLNRRIKHPNVARMFDYGVSGDYPFITMEYIPGRDLWTIVREKGAFLPEKAVPILRQIARGTAAIHALGIIHRDLKSQNILVEDDGAVVILDFGLARGNVDEHLTLSAVMLGTPHYMSPEQAQGKVLDARSDIYSIGVIAFEMLTGEVPFLGDSPVTVAMKHVTEKLPPTLRERPGISDSLRHIVEKTLEKDRENRFATVEDLETELAMLDHPSMPSQERGDDEAASPWADPDKLATELEIAINCLLMPDGTPSPPRGEPLLKPPATLSVRPSRQPHEPGQAVPVVMIVENDVYDLLRLATDVCQYGCRSLEVRSGKEALETLLVERVDLILMAAKLPELDGFDVARILKGHPDLSGIPVALFSDKPDRGALAFALQSGAVDLLPKQGPALLLGSRIWQILQYRDFKPPTGLRLSESFSRLQMN